MYGTMHMRDLIPQHALNKQTQKLVRKHLLTLNHATLDWETKQQMAHYQQLEAKGTAKQAAGVQKQRAAYKAEWDRRLARAQSVLNDRQEERDEADDGDDDDKQWSVPHIVRAGAGGLDWLGLVVGLSVLVCSQCFSFYSLLASERSVS